MKGVRHMKRLLIAAMAVSLLAGPAVQSQDGRLRYTVDDSQSEVVARVAFLGLADNTARFPDMSGSLALSFADLNSVDMHVTVDARTLTTGDSQTARLRGRQFFDVANHPTVSFTGDQIRFTGERTATVTGQITAKGITRPSSIAVTFSQPITDMSTRDPVSIVATTSIDRRQFGMTAFPLIVGNRVRITIRARMVPA
jgi:polyisoprenoid-binding protein YceI